MCDEFHVEILKAVIRTAPIPPETLQKTSLLNVYFRFTHEEKKRLQKLSAACRWLARCCMWEIYPQRTMFKSWARWQWVFMQIDPSLALKPLFYVFINSSPASSEWCVYAQWSSRQKSMFAISTVIWLFFHSLPFFQLFKRIQRK